MTIFEATQRVSNIVKSKFGCHIEFHYSPQYSSQKANDTVVSYFETLNRNLGAKFVISKGVILIPIFVETEVFGCIEIKGGDLLNPDLYDDLHILLDSTLRDFIVKTELLRRLKIEEASLVNHQENNVIPIFKKKDTNEVKNIFNFISHKEEPLKTALFISGNDYSRMRDLAVDIHSLMSRNSFVPYSVLEIKGSFMEEMANLGHISIFIPEIIDLPAYEIEDITHYLDKNITPSCPFLIISSQKSLDDLEKESLIPDKLVQILKRFHLELNEDLYVDKKPTDFWNHNPSPEIH